MWRYCLHDPGDESNTIACLKGARAIIKQTLQLYSLDELSISFNGHKNCTGLLCLLHAAMNKLSLPAQEPQVTISTSKRVHLRNHQKVQLESHNRKH